MQFSEFQLTQIKRFAATSEALRQSPMLLSTPGMAKAALSVAMKADKVPDVSKQVVDDAIHAFSRLSSYSANSKRVTGLVLLLLAIGVGGGTYLWRQAGALIGSIAMLGIIVVLFVANVFYGFVAIRPIKSQFNLTDEEVAFALNDIIADPRWRADLGSPRSA